MNRRWLWLLIGLDLLALVALAFVYPPLMLSPGPLRSGHAALAADCFACHAPLRGPAADRCIACHTLASIGLRTTRGVTIKANPSQASSLLKRSFHQDLEQPNCLACHSDHGVPKLAPGIRNGFSHALLRETMRGRCELCHAAPVDSLHRQIKENCAQCHSSTAWKPANFDHSRLFLLDSDHNVACNVCHVGGDVGRYTCFGCHEHTPENVREQHREEGIANIGDCAHCHRRAGGSREAE